MPTIQIADKPTLDATYEAVQGVSGGFIPALSYIGKKGVYGTLNTSTEALSITSTTKEVLRVGGKGRLDVATIGSSPGSTVTPSNFFEIVIDGVTTVYTQSVYNVLGGFINLDCLYFAPQSDLGGVKFLRGDIVTSILTQNIPHFPREMLYDGSSHADAPMNNNTYDCTLCFNKGGIEFNESLVIRCRTDKDTLDRYNDIHIAYELYE